MPENRKAQLDWLNYQYQKNPNQFNESQRAQLQALNTFHEADPGFFESQGVFKDTMRAIGQLPAGFVEGFSTLDTEFIEPRTELEQIARQLGHLAGFVGYVPSLLTPAGVGVLGAKATAKVATKVAAKETAERLVNKAVKKEINFLANRGITVLGEKATAKELAKGMLRNNLAGKSFTVPFMKAADGTARNFAVKSVPMGIADWGMKKLGDRKFVTGMKDMISGTKFLNTKNYLMNPEMVKEMIRGGAHLALASGASTMGVNAFQWKEKVDELVPSMIGGAVFGAGFKALGGLGFALDSALQLGLSSTAKKILTGAAGSIFQGLPSTLRGDTTPQQVYEYLLGGWFGFHEPGWGKQFAVKTVRDITLNYYNAESKVAGRSGHYDFRTDVGRKNFIETFKQTPEEFFGLDKIKKMYPKEVYEEIETLINKQWEFNPYVPLTEALETLNDPESGQLDLFQSEHAGDAIRLSGEARTFVYSDGTEVMIPVAYRLPVNGELPNGVKFVEGNYNIGGKKSIGVILVDEPYLLRKSKEYLENGIGGDKENGITPIPKGIITDRNQMVNFVIEEAIYRGLHGEEQHNLSRVISVAKAVGKEGLERLRRSESLINSLTPKERESFEREIELFDLVKADEQNVKVGSKIMLRDPVSKEVKRAYVIKVTPRGTIDERGFQTKYTKYQSVFETDMEMNERGEIVKINNIKNHSINNIASIFGTATPKEMAGNPIHKETVEVGNHLSMKLPEVIADESMGTREVVDWIGTHSQDPQLKKLANYLIDYVGDIGISFDPKQSPSGLYHINENRITIKNKDVQHPEQTILHETVHAILRDVLQKHKAGELDKRGRQYRAITEIKRVLDTALSKLSEAEKAELETFTELVKRRVRGDELSKEEIEYGESRVGRNYGLTSLSEFLPEILVEPEFQARLDEISYKGKKSVWQRVKELLLDVFGIKKNDTALSAGLMNTIDLLETLREQPRVEKKRVKKRVAVKPEGEKPARLKYDSPLVIGEGAWWNYQLEQVGEINNATMQAGVLLDKLRKGKLSGMDDVEVKKLLRLRDTELTQTEASEIPYYTKDKYDGTGSLIGFKKTDANYNTIAEKNAFIDEVIAEVKSAVDKLQIKDDGPLNGKPLGDEPPPWSEEPPSWALEDPENQPYVLFEKVVDERGERLRDKLTDRELYEQLGENVESVELDFNIDPTDVHNFSTAMKKAFQNKEGTELNEIKIELYDLWKNLDEAAFKEQLTEKYGIEDEQVLNSFLNKYRNTILVKGVTKDANGDLAIDYIEAKNNRASIMYGPDNVLWIDKRISDKLGTLISKDGDFDGPYLLNMIEQSGQRDWFIAQGINPDHFFEVGRAAGKQSLIVKMPKKYLDIINKQERPESPGAEKDAYLTKLSKLKEQAREQYFKKILPLEFIRKNEKSGNHPKVLKYALLFGTPADYMPATGKSFKVAVIDDSQPDWMVDNYSLLDGALYPLKDSTKNIPEPFLKRMLEAFGFNPDVDLSTLKPILTLTSDNMHMVGKGYSFHDNDMNNWMRNNDVEMVIPLSVAKVLYKNGIEVTPNIVSRADVLAGKKHDSLSLIDMPDEAFGLIKGAKYHDVTAVPQQIIDSVKNANELTDAYLEDYVRPHSQALADIISKSKNRSEFVVKLLDHLNLGWDIDANGKLILKAGNTEYNRSAVEEFIKYHADPFNPYFEKVTGTFIRELMLNIVKPKVEGGRFEFMPNIRQDLASREIVDGADGKPIYAPGEARLPNRLLHDGNKQVAKNIRVWDSQEKQYVTLQELIDNNYDLLISNKPEYRIKKKSKTIEPKTETDVQYSPAEKGHVTTIKGAWELLDKLGRDRYSLVFAVQRSPKTKPADFLLLKVKGFNGKEYGYTIELPTREATEMAEGDYDGDAAAIIFKLNAPEIQAYARDVINPETGKLYVESNAVEKNTYEKGKSFFKVVDQIVRDSYESQKHIGLAVNGRAVANTMMVSNAGIEYGPYKLFTPEPGSHEYYEVHNKFGDMIQTFVDSLVAKNIYGDRMAIMNHIDRMLYGLEPDYETKPFEMELGRLLKVPFRVSHLMTKPRTWNRSSSSMDMESLERAKHLMDALAINPELSLGILLWKKYEFASKRIKDLEKLKRTDTDEYKELSAFVDGYENTSGEKVRIDSELPIQLKHLIIMEEDFYSSKKTNDRKLYGELLDRLNKGVEIPHLKVRGDTSFSSKQRILDNLINTDVLSNSLWKSTLHQAVAARMDITGLNYSKKHENQTFIHNNALIEVANERTDAPKLYPTNSSKVVLRKLLKSAAKHNQMDVRAIFTYHWYKFINNHILSMTPDIYMDPAKVNRFYRDKAKMIARFASFVDQSDLIDAGIHEGFWREGRLFKIISGGQTGIDQLGVRVGKKLGFETGGTAPPKFETEKGFDPTLKDQYGIEEISHEAQTKGLSRRAESRARRGNSKPDFGAKWVPRTELNAQNADGTIYFSQSPKSAGMVATEIAAKKANSPFLKITGDPKPRLIASFLRSNNISVLNVAGNRESKASPEYLKKVEDALTEAFEIIREEQKGYRGSILENGIAKWNVETHRAHIESRMEKLWNNFPHLHAEFFMNSAIPKRTKDGFRPAKFDKLTYSFLSPEEKIAYHDAYNKRIDDLVGRESNEVDALAFEKGTVEPKGEVISMNDSLTNAPKSDLKPVSYGPLAKQGERGIKPKYEAFFNRFFDDHPQVKRYWTGILKGLIGKPYFENSTEVEYVISKLRKLETGRMNIGVYERMFDPAAHGRMWREFDLDVEHKEYNPLTGDGVKVISAMDKLLEMSTAKGFKIEGRTLKYQNVIMNLFTGKDLTKLDRELLGMNPEDSHLTEADLKNIDTIREVLKDKGRMPLLWKIAFFKREWEDFKDQPGIDIKSKEYILRKVNWESVRKLYENLDELGIGVDGQVTVDYLVNMSRTLMKHANDVIIPEYNATKQKVLINILPRFIEKKRAEVSALPPLKVLEKRLQELIKVRAEKEKIDEVESQIAQHKSLIATEKFLEKLIELERAGLAEQFVGFKHGYMPRSWDYLSDFINAVEEARAEDLSHAKTKAERDRINAEYDEIRKKETARIQQPTEAAPYIDNDALVDMYSISRTSGNFLHREIELNGYNTEIPMVFSNYFHNAIKAIENMKYGLNARKEIDRFDSRMKNRHGDKYTPEIQKRLTDFMHTYVMDNLGYPQITGKIPNLKKYVIARLTGKDPNINPDDYEITFNDQTVIDKYNKAAEKYGWMQRTPEAVQKFAMNEARYQLMSLLTHTKSMMGNMFSGGVNIVSLGSFKRLVQAHKRLKEDKELQRIFDEQGILPDLVQNEFNIQLNVKNVSTKEFMDGYKAILNSDMDKSTKMLHLKDLAAKTGVPSKILEFASKFLSKPEMELRRHAFAVGYIMGQEQGHTGEALYDFAKRFVVSTQYIYSNATRPEFGRTGAGKIATRFMHYMFQTIGLQKNLREGAKFIGATKGTQEWDQYAKWTQSMILMMALASVFPYSLFDIALAPQFDIMKDMAELMFGDAEDREKAFFGTYGLNVVASPATSRLLLRPMLTIMNQDYQNYIDRELWTWLPFGRLMRSSINAVKNPYYSVDAFTGIPLSGFTKSASMVRKQKEKGEYNRYYPKLY